MTINEQRNATSMEHKRSAEAAARLIIGPLPNGAGLLSRRDEVNFVMQFCCLPMFALLALIYGRGGCSGSEHFMLSRLR